MPHTAKNASTAAKGGSMLTPAEFKAQMLNSAEGDYEDHQAEEILLSGKINKDDSATRNTFNATTRTKVSTQQALTATGLNSP